VGSAKIGIGTGADAVVDSELRAHGLRGLRVADASVMPSIISGPTNDLRIAQGAASAAILIDVALHETMGRIRRRSCGNGAVHDKAILGSSLQRS